MKIRRPFLLLSLAAGTIWSWTYETPYRMPAPRLAGESGRSDTAWYFDSVAVGGKYARTGVVVHEGGWSGIEFDPSDTTGSSFWSISEGGLITSRENPARNDRLVAFPGYHQKLVHVSLRGDSLSFDKFDSIATWGNPAIFTNGLQNSISGSDATQLRMDLSTGAIDTSAKIAVSNDGYDFESVRYHDGAFWMSDESGPYIVKVNPSTHRIDKQWYPDNGLPKVYLRRRANRGFEAMAVTPSGMVAAMVQSPMLNAQGTVENLSTRDSRAMRLLVLDPTNGTIREHVYLNDQKPNALGATRKGRDCKVGDMVAIDDNRFLLVEHGADASGKHWIDLWKIDISKASNVTATNKIGITYSNGNLTLEQLSDSATIVANGVVPVAKTLVRGDLRTGTPWVSTQPEGLAIVNDTTVALLSDDNHGCREIESAGGPDGVCHIQHANAARSVLMYFKVPSLGWSRTAVERSVRGNPIRISARGAAVGVSWPANSNPFSVELLRPDGRRLERWNIAPSREAGQGTYPVGHHRGALVVRLLGGNADKAQTIAIP